MFVCMYVYTRDEDASLYRRVLVLAFLSKIFFLQFPLLRQRLTFPFLDASPLFYKCVRWSVVPVVKKSVCGVHTVDAAWYGFFFFQVMYYLCQKSSYIKGQSSNTK